MSKQNVGAKIWNWSKADRREGYPEKLDKILDLTSWSFSGFNRSLLRFTIDEIEKRGYPLYNTVAGKMAKEVERRIKKNGKKNHRKKR